MDFDQWRAAWFATMRAKGHTPILDSDGDIDQFVMAGGYHNGPGCSACGWECCMHCTDMERIPDCTQVRADQAARDKAEREKLTDIIGAFVP